MKQSKIFHTLYLAVMALPLFLMGVFAIYSQNHEINDNTLQVQENKVVDFNQLYYHTDYTQTSLGVTYTLTNGSVTMTGTATNSYNFEIGQVHIEEGHKYLITNYPQIMPISNNYVSSFQIYEAGIINLSISEYETINYKFGYGVGTGTANCRFRIQNGVTYDLSYYPQIYDVTQMGLENATIEQFKTYFPLDYYPYTESEEVVIENYETITYNDTDIMSQFMYVSYNALDKYLNFSQYQPFTSIYNWAQNTFFGGSAPMVFFIMFQMMCYWLVMSLFWLIFDVLLYVPSMIHKMIDKARLE